MKIKRDWEYDTATESLHQAISEALSCADFREEGWKALPTINMNGESTILITKGPQRYELELHEIF